MTLYNGNKRTREPVSPEKSIAKDVLAPILPISLTDQVNVQAPGATPSGPALKRSRAELPAQESKEDNDDPVIVQHVVCVQCDNLYTMEADIKPHVTCVSGSQAQKIPWVLSLEVAKQHMN